MKHIRAALVAGVAAVVVASTCFAAGESPVVQGNNAFAIKLYQNLASANSGRNVFLSPYSISTALAMTYAGARGETEKQMAQALQFGLPQKDLHPAFSTLMKSMESGTKGRQYKLHIANALWGQEGRKLLPEFLNIAKTQYEGGYRAVNFRRDPEASRKTINAWVEERTNKLIKDLLARNDITELTVLVLTNAIYFKGNWLTQFKKEQTKEAPFFVTPATSIPVPMMLQEGTFGHGEADSTQLLELPYAGDDLSMLVLLPKGDVREAEQLLTRRGIADLRSRLVPETVKVFLPKFKFKERYSLSQPLQDLGMVDAFDEMRADFSGMTGQKELYVSRVIHQANVDVNEEGTEAAAATAVVMSTKSMPRTTVFRADRPFLFAIMHKPTGSILFLGRVMKPGGA